MEGTQEMRSAENYGKIVLRIAAMKVGAKQCEIGHCNGIAAGDGVAKRKKGILLF